MRGYETFTITLKDQNILKHLNFSSFAFDSNSLISPEPTI